MSFPQMEPLMDPVTATPGASGPDESRMQEICARTGYPHSVTAQQRVYGPPPGMENEKLPNGTQVHIGKLAFSCYEDSLVELFEQAGTIYELRLMINTATNQNKGFAFVTFVDKESAEKAVKMYNNYELKGKKISVSLASQNNTLFIGSIPKNRSREEIHEAFSAEVEGIVDVVAQIPLKTAGQEDIKNRGFCFLNFEDYKTASAARQMLRSGKQPIKAWKDYKNYTCDWADPVEEVSEEVMSQVKTLYIKNLSERTTDEVLRQRFAQYGEIEKVTNHRHYAFVFFAERESALKAIECEHDNMLEDVKLSVELAKPVSDAHKKKIRELKEKRNERFMPRGGYNSGTSSNWVRGGPRGYEQYGGGYGYGYADPYDMHYGYGPPGGMGRGGYGDRGGKRPGGAGGYGPPAKRGRGGAAAPPAYDMGYGYGYGYEYDYAADPYAADPYGYGGGYGGGYGAYPPPQDYGYPPPPGRGRGGR